MPRSTVRRRLLAGVAAVICGCAGRPNDADGDGNGDTTGGANVSQSDTPAHGDVEQDGELTLASMAFSDGERIPEKYGHDAANVNPPLTIDGVPEDARSLALIVDDPDAVDPAGKVWVHWLVWNIAPGREQIPEDWRPDDALEGENDFGTVGYGGPSPPDAEHTYRFKLYALDEQLGLTEGATKGELGAAMEGAVLAQTQITGTYAP